MKTEHISISSFFRALCLCLLAVMAVPVIAQNTQRGAMATPLTAQDTRAAAQFRAQYDTMMSNFERMATNQGNISILEKAIEGRNAMSRVSDQQLGVLYSKVRYPDLSGGVLASEVLASRPAKSQRKSSPFPQVAPVIGNCDIVDTSPSFRYGALIAKEVTTSILAAATFVCTQDILGENGSAACIPFAIAADIAIALFDVSTFCAGEATANAIDTNYVRLEHLHNDLNTGLASVINNDNTNTSNIINNDNTNKAALVTLINANTTTIVNNDNANKNAMVGEIRALGCEIVRLLNTPDGQRASSILSCSAAPGFPYSWNKK